MGSWFATDFITNLPIQLDEPVQLFFITDSSETITGRETYSTDICSPIALPIEATYSDYGRYEFEENKHTDAILKLASLYLKCDNITWDDFWGKMVSSKRLQETSGDNTPLITVVACHRQVYEELSLEHPYYNGPRHYSHYVNENFNKIKEITDNFPEQKLPQLKTWQISDELFGWRSFLRSSSYTKSILEDAVDNDLGYLLEILAKATVFGYNLSILRKDYIPPSGCGSQDDEYELHIKLANIVISHCEKQLMDDEEYE